MLKRSLSKTRILTDKERKNLAILEVIRKSGPISRTDISRMTEFNIVTVSNYVNHYIKKSLVVEGELDESTGGRKPVLVELNPKAAYIIGVGLNMFSMVGMVVDLGTNIVYEIKREETPKNSEQMINEMISLTRELIEKSDVSRDKFVGIGIGVPGVIDEKGRTIRWPGVLGAKDLSVSMSIKDTFEKEFGIPTLVENDANAAVLGEKWVGMDQDVKNMLYLFSGVGCGIMVDGNIYRGSSGAAGELGIYSSLEENQKFLEESEVQLGRWEMDLGMAKNIQRQIEKGETSALQSSATGENGISLKEIIKAAKSGDKLATQAIEEAGYNLGRKAAFLVNLLNPEYVIIGGGIEACGATLLDMVKLAIREWAVEESATTVKVLPSAFGENAIALGVIGNVVREIFTQA